MACHRGIQASEDSVRFSLNKNAAWLVSEWNSRTIYLSTPPAGGCVSEATPKRQHLRLTANSRTNDPLRQAERRRIFNVAEFKRLAAASVGQHVEDIVAFEKLAEGGYNRTFLISMRDGLQFVGRIPYLSTKPRQLVIANEVATMDFLRTHGIPVPVVYDYSTTAGNGANTEYVFMELASGTNLGDVWFDMPEKARILTVTKLVELEAQLFNIRFPASGSLFYRDDLSLEARDASIDIPNTKSQRRFCLGPDIRLNLWYGKRHDLQVDRGPYTDSEATLAAGCNKELAYLKKFGRPLHPFQRVRREVHNYQKQSHLKHMENLNKYLKILPYLTPHTEALTHPTLRHPDLQPNNVFVSEKLEITGLIDWQHCAVLPLFLQCGIPNSLQNYGDYISESLQEPRLPADFDDMEESRQFQQVMLLRQRQLHYQYVTETEKLNPIHHNAMNERYGTLRRKLFHHASDPWEGDTTTLESDLIHFTMAWPEIVNGDLSADNHNTPSCPIEFPRGEAEKCLRLDREQMEADEQFQACIDAIGVGPEGWVPSSRFSQAQQSEEKLKADALDAAESDEDRRKLNEHWIFSDFDEEEYS